MGLDVEPQIRMWNKVRIAYIKSELKANRKRNGHWKIVPNHGLPGQVYAIRSIAPRGREIRWNNGTITTDMPSRKGGAYHWEQTAER